MLHRNLIWFLSLAEILLGILAQRGYARTAEPLEADVVLLNTCAIREHAEQKIFCRLGELRAQLSRSTAATSRFKPACLRHLACCCFCFTLSTGTAGLMCVRAAMLVPKLAC